MSLVPSLPELQVRSRVTSGGDRDRRGLQERTINSPALGGTDRWSLASAPRPAPARVDAAGVPLRRPDRPEDTDHGDSPRGQSCAGDQRVALGLPVAAGLAASVAVVVVGLLCRGSRTLLQVVLLNPHLSLVAAEAGFTHTGKPAGGGGRIYFLSRVPPDKPDRDPPTGASHRVSPSKDVDITKQAVPSVGVIMGNLDTVRAIYRPSPAATSRLSSRPSPTTSTGSRSRSTTGSGT